MRAVPSVTAGLGLLMVVSLGCSPADPPAASNMDAGAEVNTDAVKTVTYTKDVQPILLAKCSPCHAGQRQGFQNVATTYEDALRHVESSDSVDCWKDQGAPEMSMPKTIGECSLISVRNGRMPFGIGCGQSPTQAACVQPAEQEIIAAWVAAGMPR